MTHYDDTYTRYQSDRSVIRKFVRKAYLRRAASLVRGPTLDFGCGIGELLAYLPPGSKGVEYNRASVELCRARGLLDVLWYDGTRDGWTLSALPTEWRFKSMVISHVLEHLEAPAEVLPALLQGACSRGVERVLVIVPGRAGFRIDPTHRTFIGADFFSSPWLSQRGWHVRALRYFPGNVRNIGDYFPHHELQVVLEPLSSPC